MHKDSGRYGSGQDGSGRHWHAPCPDVPTEINRSTVGRYLNLSTSDTFHAREASLEGADNSSTYSREASDAPGRRTRGTQSCDVWGRPTPNARFSTSPRPPSAVIIERMERQASSMARDEPPGQAPRAAPPPHAIARGFV